MKCSIDIKTNDYLDNIVSRGFVPLTCRPTRITTTTATLIDHVYTNILSYPTTSGIIITDVADHFGTFHLVSEKNTKVSTTPKYRRSYSETNINQFRQYLSQLNFDEVTNEPCTNNSYDTFLALHKGAFDLAFPQKIIM